VGFIRPRPRGEGHGGIFQRAISERLFRPFDGWSRIKRMLHVRHPRLTRIVKQFKTQDPRRVSLPSVLAWFTPADWGGGCIPKGNNAALLFPTPFDGGSFSFGCRDREGAIGPQL